MLKATCLQTVQLPTWHSLACNIAKHAQKMLPAAVRPLNVDGDLLLWFTQMTFKHFKSVFLNLGPFCTWELQGRHTLKVLAQRMQANNPSKHSLPRQSLKTSTAQARSHLSEKSGRLRCLNIILVLSRVARGLAMPFPAMSLPTCRAPCSKIATFSPTFAPASTRLKPSQESTCYISRCIIKLTGPSPRQASLCNPQTEAQQTE